MALPFVWFACARVMHTLAISPLVLCIDVLCARTLLHIRCEQFRCDGGIADGTNARVECIDGRRCCTMRGVINKWALSPTACIYSSASQLPTLGTHRWQQSAISKPMQLPTIFFFIYCISRNVGEHISHIYFSSLKSLYMTLQK